MNPDMNRRPISTVPTATATPPSSISSIITTTTPSNNNITTNTSSGTTTTQKATHIASLQHKTLTDMSRSNATTTTTTTTTTTPASTIVGTKRKLNICDSTSISATCTATVGVSSSSSSSSGGGSGASPVVTTTTIPSIASNTTINTTTTNSTNNITNDIINGYIKEHTKTLNKSLKKIEKEKKEMEKFPYNPSDDIRGIVVRCGILNTMTKYARYLDLPNDFIHDYEELDYTTTTSSIFNIDFDDIPDIKHNNNMEYSEDYIEFTTINIQCTILKYILQLDIIWLTPYINKHIVNKNFIELCQYCIELLENSVVNYCSKLINIIKSHMVCVQIGRFLMSGLSNYNQNLVCMLLNHKFSPKKLEIDPERLEKEQILMDNLCNVLNTDRILTNYTIYKQKYEKKQNKINKKKEKLIKESMNIKVC